MTGLNVSPKKYLKGGEWSGLGQNFVGLWGSEGMSCHIAVVKFPLLLVHFFSKISGPQRRLPVDLVSFARYVEDLH